MICDASHPTVGDGSRACFVSSTKFLSHYHQNASPVAVVEKKYAEPSVIFDAPGTLGLTVFFSVVLVFPCVPARDAHIVQSHTVCLPVSEYLTLFSVLHCSSRKQKGYHLSFGWIIQRGKHQLPLCARLCNELSEQP